MSDIQSGTLSIKGRAYRPLHATYYAAEWQAQNPILQRGEIGVVQDSNLFKVGDGITRWNDLDYATGQPGPQGPAGDDGATFIPSVSEAGEISWTNNAGLPNPPTQNIRGPQGPLGTNAPIVTTISASSTDLEVCSAKCVYDTVGIINNALHVINVGA